jgi:hypothetical protein
MIWSLQKLGVLKEPCIHRTLKYPLLPSLEQCCQLYVRFSGQGWEIFFKKGGFFGNFLF